MNPVELTLPSILFVVSSMAVGGTEKHLAAILTALRARGWDVTVYSTGGDGALTQVFLAGGVRVILPPRFARRLLGFPFGARFLRLPVTALYLLGVLMRQRFSIIHFFLPEAYLVGAPVALLAGIKLRVMSRRSLNAYQGGHALSAFVERCLHVFVAAALANSRSVARQLEAEGIAAQRIGLIYNGLTSGMPAAAMARDRIRNGLGLRETTLVLVIVANLIPYKGHLDLVEALGRVADSMPADWCLLIVGRDDGAGAAVRARAQTVGIADKILFLGERNDVPDLLSACDIGLLTSHQEGFSNAIIESMYAGLPMIVTDVGGNAEAVVDGQSGLVVPARHPVALAAAIERLSCDPQLRERYGEEGHRRATTYFGLDGCVAAYEALYRGLLSGKSPADIPEIQYRP
jgi:glycosyltransferase involved in cell wall biosynthesis